MSQFRRVCPDPCRTPESTVIGRDPQHNTQATLNPLQPFAIRPIIPEKGLNASGIVGLLLPSYSLKVVERYVGFGCKLEG